MQILESTFVILNNLCDLSSTLSKVSMLSCDSCPSIAHYAQLSQVRLHVAVSLNFEPWLFPNYSSFITAPIIPKEIPKYRVKAWLHSTSIQPVTHLLLWLCAFTEDHMQ